MLSVILVAISCNLPFAIRKAVAKFRFSNHKLNIEVGRHAGIPRKFRTCSHCLINNNSYQIEDEYHAFFKCSLYDDIRQRYLPSNLCNTKSLYEFYNILSHNDPNVIKHVSEFIFHMMKRRNTLLL